MTPIKKAGWQAGLTKYVYLHSTRLALLLVMTSSFGVYLAALIVLAALFIGRAL